MTACKDSLSGKKAVSATLAGVLAVGMVPAAAFAADQPADTTTGDEGVSLQFQEGTKAFENGTATYTVKQGADTAAANKTTVGGVVDSYKYVKNTPINVEVSQITLEQGTVVELTNASQATGTKYTMDYYERNTDGSLGAACENNEAVKPGKYAAVLTATSGDYKGATFEIDFNIAPRSVAVSAVDAEKTYNAEVQDWDFTFADADNGNAAMSLDRDVDYTVYYVPAGGGSDESLAVEPKDAGDYRAVVKFTDSGYTFSTDQSNDNVTINALNLGDDTVSVEDQFTTGTTVPALDSITIDGVRYGEGSAILDELKGTVADGSVVLHNGEYVLDVTKADASNKNITDTASANLYKVEQIANFKYDGDAMPASYEWVKTDAGKAFDSSKVTAESADGKLKLTVGVGVSDPTVPAKAGKYTLVYSVNDLEGNGNNYEIGGKAVVEYTVYKEAVDADAQVQVLFDKTGNGVTADDQVVTSLSKTYDGTNWASMLNVRAKDAAGNAIKAKDLTVKFYNADGKQVSKVVNAGTYTMKVTSSKYKLAGTTEMTITVGKKAIDGTISALRTKTFDNTAKTVSYLPAPKETGWDGTASTTADTNQNGYDAVELFGADFPYQQCTITLKDADGNTVDRIAKEGAYTVEVTPRNDDAATNYSFPEAQTVEVIAAKHLLYADVTYKDWFADEVADVTAAGFMHGYDKTDLFGPNSDITRGQVAVVLYNMAQKTGHAGDETLFEYSTTTGYKSFGDVDGTQYYGKAVAWAKQAGVVSGYGDGTFKADQSVTREEFAKMLANYAQKFGTYAAAGNDAYAKYADASSVDAWASEAVAWAVSNGIMGKNTDVLSPLSSINRAEAGAMAVRYAAK